MKPETTASKLLAHLGVYSMLLGSKIVYRGATPPRKVMGRNGTKRAGAYGRGLRNWIDSKTKVKS